VKYKLETSVSGDGVISQSLLSSDIQDHINEVTRWVCDTREATIKQALINLGWTPPEKE